MSDAARVAGAHGSREWSTAQLSLEMWRRVSTVFQPLVYRSSGIARSLAPRHTGSIRCLTGMYSSGSFYFILLQRTTRRGAEE